MCFKLKCCNDETNFWKSVPDLKDSSLLEDQQIAKFKQMQKIFFEGASQGKEQ